MEMRVAGEKRARSSSEESARDEGARPTTWHCLLTDVEAHVFSYLTYCDVMAFSVTCKDFYLKREHHVHSVEQVKISTHQTPHFFRHLLADQKNQGDGEACVRGMRGLKQLIVFNSSNEHNDNKDGTQQRTQVQGNGAPGLGNDEGSGAMTQATPFSVFQKRLSLFPAFFPRLVKLSLADCGIGLDGVTALVDGMKQQGGWLSLEVLELRHNLLCSQAFALLMEGLSSCCPSLHTLSVENNHVGAHGMVQVGKACTPLPPRLRHLNLRDNELSSLGLSALASRLARGECVDMQYLSLAVNNIGADGVEALSCAMASGHLSQLKSLELSCNNLSLRRHDGPVVGGYNGGRGVRGVAEALRYCPRLETLHLDDTDMGKEEAKSLARALASGGLPSLAHLNLAENFLEPQGVEALASALCSKRVVQQGKGRALRDLVMDGTGMDDHAALQLVDALRVGGYSGVRSLSLRGNDEIGDTGVTDIAAVLTNKGALEGLETLNLGYTNMGDDGLLALVKAFKTGACPALARLNMRCTKVANHGLHKLMGGLLTSADHVLPMLVKVDAQHTNVVASEKLRRMGLQVVKQRPELELLHG